MTIQTTRWSPDTCKCMVEYEWDDAVALDARTHTLKQFISKCARHAQFTDAQVWSRLTDENPRKNLLRGLLIANFAAFRQTFTDPVSGQTWDDLKAGVTFGWSFDANHVLHIQITPLTGNQRNALQSAADTRFGAGKVIID